MRIGCVRSSNKGMMGIRMWEGRKEGVGEEMRLLEGCEDLKEEVRGCEGRSEGVRMCRKGKRSEEVKEGVRMYSKRC